MVAQAVPKGLRDWYFDPVTQLYSGEKKVDHAIHMKVIPGYNFSHLTYDDYARAIRLMGNQQALEAIKSSSALSESERGECLEMQKKLESNPSKGFAIIVDPFHVEDEDLIKRIWRAVQNHMG